MTTYTLRTHPHDLEERHPPTRHFGLFRLGRQVSGHLVAVHETDEAHIPDDEVDGTLNRPKMVQQPF